jgi:hypothetical protein
MPKGKIAFKFHERLIIVEQKILNIVTFQKWQMALLAAIFLAALKAAVK